MLMGEIMKEIYSEKIKQSLNINKRVLIVIIILLLAVGGCIFWAIEISNKPYPESTHLNTVIVDQDNKEDVYACVTVNAIPYVFAETSDDEYENKYYFIRDEDYFYVAFLNYETFSKLNHEDIEENPIEICGMTKRITDDIKNIGIEVYNEAMEEEIVNKSNFKDYFGEVYIDVTEPVNDNFVPVIFAILLGSFTIIIIPIYIASVLRTKKVIKNISQEEWQQINNEMEDPNTIYYNKAKLYLTKNYIVDFSRGMTIIKYSNILWMYPHELRQYGITTTKSIIIVDKDFKNYTIAGLSNFGKKSKEAFTEVMESIMNKNKYILIGYTKENQNKVKELKQNKRS